MSTSTSASPPDPGLTGLPRAATSVGVLAVLLNPINELAGSS